MAPYPPNDLRIILLQWFSKMCRPARADSAFAGPCQGLIEELEQAGSTLVVVHHAGKGRTGEGPAALSRGTTALPAVPSMLLALAKVNPASREDRRLLLMVEGRGGPPETLAILREEDSWLSCGSGEEIVAEQRREASREKLTPRQEAALELIESRWTDGKGESTVVDLLAEPECELAGKNAGRLGRKVLQALARMQLIELRKVGTGLSARPWGADGPQGPLSSQGPSGPQGPQNWHSDGSEDLEDLRDQPSGGDQGNLFADLEVA